MVIRKCFEKHNIRISWAKHSENCGRVSCGDHRCRGNSHKENLIEELLLLWDRVKCVEHTWRISHESRLKHNELLISTDFFEKN